MRRLLLPGLAALVVAVAVGCGGGDPVPPNEFGDCVFGPGAVCERQDFTAIDLSGLDLSEGKFAGSDFTAADLQHVDLRGADLQGVTLTRADLRDADLRGADLSDTKIFAADLEGARWAGSRRNGINFCETLLPDGSVSDCPEIDKFEVPVSTAPPPSVVTFAPARPKVCVHDAIGQGVMVDWRVRDATNVVFLVDDVPAGSAGGRRGYTRLPFPCDGDDHTVTIRAFGPTAPPAARAFELRLTAGLG